jgi:hypothetical protein
MKREMFLWQRKMRGWRRGGIKGGGVGYKKKVRSDRVRRRIMGKEENCLTLKDNG